MILMLFITWNNILVVLCMHMINFYFYFFRLSDFVFIIIIAWFFANGRFNRDLKEHSTQNGYEEGMKERYMKVLEKMLCFLESGESVREEDVISFSEKRITKAVRGRGKWNIQYAYGQNEGYVQGGGVLIVLDFVKLMDGRFSFKGDAAVFWKRRVGTQTHHESFEKQDCIWKACFY